MAGGRPLGSVPGLMAPAWRFPGLVSAALNGVRSGKYHHHQRSSSHIQCDINKKINSVCPIFSPIPSLYKNTKSSELGRLALRSRPVRGSCRVGWEQRLSRLWS